MNKRGHVKTLVSSHPGNTNAAKNGVYSTRMLAPRVAELEGSIESLTVAEGRRDIARHDLAGLMALTEALDAALSADGVMGRRGQVKDLVKTRLRASGVTRSAIFEYGAAVAAIDELEKAAELDKDDDGNSESVSGDLVRELAEAFGVPSTDEVDPISFDALCFLTVITDSADPTVRASDRTRANRLLLKNRGAGPGLCGCKDVRRARDALEFECWVEEFRPRVALSPYDPTLARYIRHLGGGGTYERAHAFARTTEALEWVTDYELARVRGDAVHEGGAAEEEEDRRLRKVGRDRLLMRFWRTMVSPNPVSAKDRLQAYVELEKAGALRKCVCPSTDPLLQEEKEDESDALVIRSFVRLTRLGAQLRVAFPESYLAVRQMLDSKIPVERGIDTAGHNDDDDRTAEGSVS